MIKRLTALALAGLLLQMAYARPAAAKPATEKEAQFAEKVRAGVARLGTGPEARIEVKLQDGTKLKGYVSAATDESFSVADPKTGAVTQVAYPQVKVARGNNLTKGERMAIIFGVGVALIVVLAVVIGHGG